MRDLEEDPSMRTQINLYRDEEFFEAQAKAETPKVWPSAFGQPGGLARGQAPPAAAEASSSGAAARPAGGGGAAAAVAGLGSDDEGDEEDDDFPEVGLEELLDDLSLGVDADAGPPSPQPAGPVTFAPPVEHFTLPSPEGAAAEEPKFFF